MLFGSHVSELVGPGLQMRDLACAEAIMTGSNAFVFVPKAVCDPKRAGDSREAELLCALAWDSQAGLSGLLCPCSTDLTRIA